MPMTTRLWKYGKDINIIPQTAFSLLLALALIAGLLGVTTGTAHADVNLFVIVVDCVTGLPIAGAQIKVPTANLSLNSASQAVANDKGVANVDPLRTGGKHQIKVSAPGYQSKSLDVSFPAWTTQEVLVCLQPENPSSPPSKPSDCNRALIAVAEQRVAALEAKLEQTNKEKGDALDRYLDSKEYVGAVRTSDFSHDKAAAAVHQTEYAIERAESVMRLAKTEPGSDNIGRDLSMASAHLDVALNYTFEALNEPFYLLNELRLLFIQNGDLRQVAASRNPGETKNLHTDAEYIKAAEDVIKMAKRIAEIARAADDTWRAKKEELFTKWVAAVAAYHTAKETELAIKSELAQARTELQALRDACYK